MNALLDNPDALRNASVAEALALVPKQRTKQKTRNGKGYRFSNPEKLGEQIRIMNGDPDDPNPLKRGAYLRVSRNGSVSAPIPLSGVLEIEP